MTSRKSLWIAFAALMFAAAIVPAGASNDASRTTYLTFSQPVRLPGVALASGTYIFELASPMGSSGVVRVMSRDRRIAYFQGFTRDVARPQRISRNETTVSLGEAAQGSAPPIVAWWPMGLSTGHEFIYR
jgi:hypothetical protein